MISRAEAISRGHPPLRSWLMMLVVALLVFLGKDCLVPLLGIYLFVVPCL